MEIYIEKQKETRKADIIAAFYSAYFQRLKTLSGKELEDVLNKINDAGEEEMSDKQMLLAFKRVSASFGGGEK